MINIRLMKAKTRKSSPRFFTLGHSNRSIAEFIELLKSQKLKLLVDVRTIPKSLHNPQFGAVKLANSLKKAHIEYIYLPELGGLRSSRKDSPNKGWKNASFRNYADHMQTEEFKKGMEKLIRLSKRKKLAYMCAEAVPWRCHRRLISDTLVVQGYAVMDIFSKTTVKPHKLTEFAKVNRRTKNITYPPYEDASNDKV